ncbi:defensin-like protein 278 [Brassica napus]|uniref:defensin-like protein 278 n=1 Tax=Brassica napus TaxID=3708 RepID=UPI00207952FB|nr:defensin-like protein 278 [Brassica napus]
MTFWYVYFTGLVMSARMQEISTNDRLIPITCNTDQDCAKYCKGPIHKCKYHTCACVPGNPNCC